MSYKAFVSSTFRDLERHREVVIRRLRKAGFTVDPMEDWTADSRPPKEFCQERLDGCDLCVLLLGLRRGHVPAGHRKSITQLEVAAAQEQGIDTLVFMADESAAWPAEFNEIEQDPDLREWRNGFLESKGVSFFNGDPESVEVGPALTRWIESRTRKRLPRMPVLVAMGLLAIAVVVTGALWLSKPEVPEEFDIAFQMDFEAPFPNVSYKQYSPKWRDLDYLAYQTEEYILKEVDAPPLKQTYFAEIKRRTETSTRGSTSAPTKLCFRLVGSPGGEHPRFDCEQGRMCIPSDKYDWLEVCDDTARRTRWLPSLFPPAYAAEATDAPGWVVPALDTLERRHREDNLSFISFDLKTGPLSGPAGERSTMFDYQIYVNDWPIYVDDWSRRATRKPFDASAGVELKFGLENLDFSGAHQGEEIIRVVMGFYDGERMIEEVTFERRYVALRDVEPVQGTVDGIDYVWTGNFVIGSGDKYEVFVWSTTNPGELANRKKWFDSLDLKPDDREVVSVIRPPLGENPWYGLVVGLVDEAGRIQFTFDQPEADRILSWVEDDLASERVSDPLHGCPEAHRPHPIVRDPRIEMLKGH